MSRIQHEMQTNVQTRNVTCRIRLQSPGFISHTAIIQPRIWANKAIRPFSSSSLASSLGTSPSARVYSVLSSYLKNRPLKMLRSVLNNDGFEIWRRLSVELQPTSRSRSLAMAQALVSFPAMSKGASLYLVRLCVDIREVGR